MRQNEKDAVVRLVRHMQGLQRQIAEPTSDEATYEEVVQLIDMLWEWTPTPRHRLPSKHTVEMLVGLFRGCHPREYSYISRAEVARIIRKEANMFDNGSTLSVCLCKDADKMNNYELYDNGKWNYRETELVGLLFNLHANPQMFKD